MEAIRSDIAETDVEGMNERLSGEIYGKFNIGEVVAGVDGQYTASLEKNLNELRKQIETDLAKAVNYISMENADLLFKSVKVMVQVSKEAFEIMKKYGFTSVVLRDTKGFTDTYTASTEQREVLPSIAELGGVQACIFMNEQNAAIPEFVQSIYGNFIKSVFEVAPVFLVERNLSLAYDLTMGLGGNLTSMSADAYDICVQPEAIRKSSFTGIREYLVTCGVIGDDNTLKDSLMGEYEWELLLPDTTSSWCGTDASYCHIYRAGVCGVFGKILQTLRESDKVVDRMAFELIRQLNLQDTLDKSIMHIFQDEYLERIIGEYCDYGEYDKRDNLVRPRLGGLDKYKLLDDLFSGERPLLGPNGGITTCSEAAVLAATGKEVISLVLSEFREEVLEDLKEKVKALPVDAGFAEALEGRVKAIWEGLAQGLVCDYTDSVKYKKHKLINMLKLVPLVMEVRELWENNGCINVQSAICVAEKLDNLRERGLIIEPSDYRRFLQLYVLFEKLIQELGASLKEAIVNHS